MPAYRSTITMMLSLILVGCQSTGEEVTAPVHTEGQCNASAVESYVGKQASPAILDQARRESGAATARISRPDDIVTLEYNPKRLTLTTDKALRIQRVSCG